MSSAGRIFSGLMKKVTANFTQNSLSNSKAAVLVCLIMRVKAAGSGGGIGGDEGGDYVQYVCTMYYVHTT